jgi:multidrug efflux system membrane fusion protein
MHGNSRLVSYSALSALATSLAFSGWGCSPAPQPTASLPAPIVAVSAPKRQTSAAYEYFTGQAEALERVDVNSRISGHLIAIHFKPGAEVKAGDLLFEIDPAPLQSELERAEADLALANAKLDRTTKELVRYAALREKNAVSQDDLERVTADKLESAAMQQGAIARINTIKLNLGYAKITAPISGRIGDRLVTVGNYISGQFQNTLSALTSIVSVDPMTVAFDLDEATLQRVQRAVSEGKLTLVKEGAIPVEVGLATDGVEYPLQGEIYFLNNQVDRSTGTIRVRATIPNPPITQNGARRVSPGMFARVRVPLGEPREVTVVPEAALGFDQGDRFLYVLGAGNKAEQLFVNSGRLIGDLRIVESVFTEKNAPRPLQASEQVIVSGIQRVRPGMVVDPKPATAPAP